MRKVNDCRAIHLNHVKKPLFLDARKLAIFSKAGVVDEQIDFNPLIVRESKNLFWSRWIGQVAR